MKISRIVYHDDTRQAEKCQNYIMMMSWWYWNNIGDDTWCFVNTKWYQLIPGLLGIVWYIVLPGRLPEKTDWESLQGANQGSLAEGLSTVDLLLLTSLDQLLSILKILFTFLQNKLSLWGQFCWAFSIHYVLPGYSGAHWVNILRGRLTTVGLLIKLARFRKKAKVF